MAAYQVVDISPFNHYHQQQVEALLNQEKIRKDRYLDYTCGIFDEAELLIATGSCFANSLRCIAVAEAYQGQGLMNKLLTHLVNEQYARGHYHLFVYTKASNCLQFKDLGFYEIAYVADEIVFMENKRAGFQTFLTDLLAESPIKKTGQIAGIVMNCNPFTLGHQYLIEHAASENDWVHLFVVEEDVSVFPFEVRLDLVKQGVAHLNNITVHTTGPYLISAATFPSYFQEDEDAVVRSQIQVEAQIFIQIAHHLGINRRYVGTEPHSHVTQLYNQGLATHLGESDIELVTIPRKVDGSEAISASYVRQALKDGDLTKVKAWVPDTTYQFLMSPAAQIILQALKESDKVVHH